MANLNRLKIVLVEKSKTAKWLSDQIGKNPTTVSNWCRNTTQPSIETLARIAEVLEVEPGDLLVSLNKGK